MQHTCINQIHKQKKGFSNAETDLARREKKDVSVFFQLIGKNKYLFFEKSTWFGSFVEKWVLICKIS